MRKCEFNSRHRFVEGLPSRFFLIHRGQFAEAILQQSERTLFAQKFSIELAQLINGCGIRNTLLSGSTGGIDVNNHGKTTVPEAALR